MQLTAGGLNTRLLQSDPDAAGQQHGDNRNVAGGPGTAFLFFDTLLRTAPLNSTLELIEGYVALAGSGTVDALGRASGLTLLHRNGSMCAVACRYVIDGSPEGYGAAAFGLPVVFGREAWHNSTADDATTRAEAYAGRRTFAVGGNGPPVDPWSDKAVEREDTSSGAGTITNICNYGADAGRDGEGGGGGGGAPRGDAPWLLTGCAPPHGASAPARCDAFAHCLVVCLTSKGALHPPPAFRRTLPALVAAFVSQAA